MSDSENEAPKTVKKPISEAKKKALAINIKKAQAGKVAAAVKRKQEKSEKDRLLEELLEEKRASKTKKDTKTADSSLSDEAKEDQKTACSFSEDEVDPLPSEDSEEDSDESEDSDSESSSSGSDSEFVLKRRGKSAKAVGSSRKPSQPKKSEMYEQMRAMSETSAKMAAELAALKKEKKKSSKVNVYVNQPEKKALDPVKKKQLLNLD